VTSRYLHCNGAAYLLILNKASCTFSRRLGYLRIVANIRVFLAICSAIVLIGFCSTRTHNEGPLQGVKRSNPAVRISLLQPLGKGSRDEESQYLSACCIVRDAGDILHEFIIRNFLAGVDHFYFYDDSSEFDNLGSLLSPFAHLVTILRPPSQAEFLSMAGMKSQGQYILNHPQQMAYWHCYQTFGKNSTWMVSLDSDEFFETFDPSTLISDLELLARIPFMHTHLKKVEKLFPSQTARWNTVLSNGRILPPKPSCDSISRAYSSTCGSNDNISDESQAGELYSAKTVLQPK
jgi:hypothetical protein